MPLLRRGDIVRIRDERWTVARHLRYASASIVDVHGCDRNNRGVRTRFLLPFEPVERLPPARAPLVVSARRARHLARQVLAEAVPAADVLRCLPRAAIDLLPFQLEPALAVLRGRAARVLLADEVGLGKTVQAGLIVAEMLERHPDARVLVVAPASLREQWRHELQARFGLEALLIDSASLARPGTRVPAGANPWAAPLVIASIDYLKRAEVLRSLEALVWDAVVIDEAHGLAGRSDRHAAAQAVGARARTMVLLTATPHAGDDDAFARLCGIGDLDGRFPLLVFRRTRQQAGLGTARRSAWLRVAPTAAEMRMHRELARYTDLVRRHAADASATAAAAWLAMLVLTRRACSSAASLAGSVERRLALLAGDAPEELQLPLPLGVAADEDAEPGSELAAPGLADAADERRRLETILALSRLAQGHESKLRALRRFLRRTREPAIVFTEYRDTLAHLGAALAGFRTVHLHGGLSTTERLSALRQFTSGDADVLLATDAASEGLNLQHRCRLVVHLELPWTPSRLEQRVGRVDRIGQPRRVHQVHLVAADTAEERTVAPIVRARTARLRRALSALEDSECLPLPEGVFVADFLHAAIDEVARASMARALRPPGTMDAPTRPFVTATHGRVSRAFWAFRQALTDPADEVLSEAMFGISHALSSASAARAADVRRLAGAAQHALADVLREHQDALSTRLLAASEALVSLALSREQAILRAIARRQARLAAALVQPGLFGRSAEREAAAQHEALHETTRRCEERIARLERRRRIAGARVEPVFAVFLR